MSRRLIFLIGAIAVLIIGGGLTSFIVAEGASSLVPGVLTVTTRPEASVSQFGGNQGFWLIALIGFIVFNLVGASLTGAAISWFLSREVARAKAMESAHHKTINDALKFRRTSTTGNEISAQSES